MESDLKELLELIEGIVECSDELQPVIEKLGDKLINYGSVLGKIIASINAFVVDQNIKAYNKYKKAGIEGDHLIAIVLKSSPNWAELLKNVKISTNN